MKYMYCWFCINMTMSMFVVGMNIELHDELMHMMKVDQEVRSDIASLQNPITVETMKKIDEQHTTRLKEIILSCGWPNKELVGQDGALAAWILAQHSSDVAFQKNVLQCMQQGLERNLVDPVHYAYLYDRVAMHEGRLQRYGTQANILDRQLVIYPIENQESVDERRKSVGLDTLSDYVSSLHDVYASLLN